MLKNLKIKYLIPFSSLLFFSCRKKNKDFGFTLIEVMFAVALMGLILIPLMNSENNIITRVINFSAQMQRTFALTFFLADNNTTQGENKGKVEEKIEEPPTTLTLEEKKAEGKKFKKFPDMYMQKATATYDVAGRKRTDVLVGFVFKAEKHDEK